MLKNNLFLGTLNKYQLHRVSKYLASGSYSEAEALLASIIKRDPLNNHALFKYAIIAQYREDWYETIKRLERALEAADVLGDKPPKQVQKSFKQAVLKRVDELLKADRLDEAEEQLQKVLDLYPRNLSVLTRLAEVSTLRKDWLMATKRWKCLLEEREALGKKLSEQTRKSFGQAALKRTDELLEADRLDEAKEQLQEVLALYPKNLAALTRIADISSKQSNWTEALNLWERVVELEEAEGKKMPKSRIVNLRFYRRYLKSGLLRKKDTNYIEAVQDYWRSNYGNEIDPSLHLAFYNLTGKKDLRIVPREQMRNEIIPFFNDLKMWAGYSDKNIYDKLVIKSSSDLTVLKRVRGNYFDANNNNLTFKNAFKLILDHKNDLIIKPSKTDNGIGIRKLTYNKGIHLEEGNIQLKDLENIFGSNFIIQKVIQQHPVMAVPHPSSVNTLRVVTLRWKNEIIHLLTFARFGTDGSIRDNAGKGGLCCGITDLGEFMDFAIDEFTKVYKYHPTSKYCFAERSIIPNYDQIIRFALELHKDILHFDLISWDIAVGVNGQPIFIEANYRGATWLYQLATQRPIFGELTEEVLNYISDELKKDKNIRDQKANID